MSYGLKPRAWGVISDGSARSFAAQSHVSFYRILFCWLRRIIGIIGVMVFIK